MEKRVKELSEDNTKKDIKIEHLEEKVDYLENQLVQCNRSVEQLRKEKDEQSTN